jgi:tRNA U54 and U55 pseudouridine synthase Pus10
MCERDWARRRGDWPFLPLREARKVNSGSVITGLRARDRSAFQLCGYCVRRQGLPIRSRASRRLATAKSASNCEICEGQLSRVKKIADRAAKILQDYEFENFLVGTTLPQSMIEKEDEIRSILRIRGVESLKTQITRSLGKRIGSITGKKVEYSRPDLTIVVSLNEGSVAVNPRSIWISARYMKKERGIPQKSRTCSTCSGLGCADCGFKGASSMSVQSIASEYLSGLFGAENCNFIWLGGEDENSLVLGDGRPFYAELLKPRRRSPPDVSSMSTEVKKKEGGGADASPSVSKPAVEGCGWPTQPFREKVEIVRIEMLQSRPTRIPLFKVEVEAHMLGKENPQADDDNKTTDSAARDFEGLRIRATPTPDGFRDIERQFGGTTVSVQVTRKFKRVQKRVDSLKFAFDERARTLDVRIICDGGIPIKKFLLSGDDSVLPNLSSFLSDFTIDSSRPFDILAVDPMPFSAPRTSGVSPARGRGGHRRGRAFPRPSNSLRGGRHDRSERKKELKHEGDSHESDASEEDAEEVVTLSAC